ncbi:MAG: hypothetical protein P1P74_10800 [Desulfuromonadales bacterium]|nr:hypothetical protein [Desulfuromonadales bacterium]MDT8422205.1 hypothetical protein [Desulfuromonadales bacterium]
MLKNRLKKLTIFFSFAALVFTGQTSAAGLVWCVGEDDHSAIESLATKGGCAAQADTRNTFLSSRTQCDQEQHCGPCVDISTAYDATTNRISKNISLDSGVEFVAADKTAVPTLARTLLAQSMPYAQPRISQTILVHRTIVLLN